MVTSVSNGFKASQYQAAIYDFVQKSLASVAARRNLVISAKAGTGKSTTIAGTGMLSVIPVYMTVLYLTFMREVNLDLGEKVKKTKEELNGSCPQAEVRTCHSIGNGCLVQVGIKGNPMQNGRKYNHLCQDYLKAHMAQYDYKLSESLADLVNKVRVTLSDTDEASLAALIRRYDIDIVTSDKETWPIILKAVPEILKAGIALAKEKIDFTDQIWLPSSKAMNLQPNRYDIVMIDEAQDLSPCIRELALKTAKKDGMVISVGDKKQAIMAFAGASPRSLDELKEATNAVELPLNKNYRCPKSVIRLAQQFVPEIEAWEESPEGEIEHIHQANVASLAQIGDMILSRYNAPLVEMAIDLIKMRKRCIVKGKDLGGNVTDFLKRVMKFYQENAYKFHPIQPEMLYADLVKYVDEYESRMLAVLRVNEEENEGRINKLEDDCATLLALYEGYQEEANSNGSYDGFVTFIVNFFAEHGETKGEIKPDARKFTITLSTGHKAKGLENPNVFILGYDELPSSKAKTEEAKEQERNLLYVMITRPQKKLYCVVKSPEMYAEVEEETEDELTNELDEANLAFLMQSHIVEGSVSPVEAQETALTIEEVQIPSQPEKRPYGGRKSLPDEDKRVFFQQTWDRDVRAAFSKFTELMNSDTESNLSEADVLEMLVLSHPAFASFFDGQEGKEYKDGYDARLRRAEDRRQAYKNRKKHDKQG